MPASEPVLRRLTSADAETCAMIANRVGWSHSTSNWHQFVHWGGNGALCLTVDGRIVTTAVALIYSERLAWVGAVITDPDYQGRGLAKTIMAAVMDYTAKQHVQSVMLDASPLGFPIYEKLGFRSLYKMEVWTGNAVSVLHTPAMLATEADQADVIALDAHWMGLERRQVIQDIWQPGHVWVTRENGALTGYLMAQADHRGVHLGPWYHRTPEGANDLLLTALSTFSGQSVRMQIPEVNTAALSLVEHQGLSCSRFCTRMVYGTEPPGNMSTQYGIIGFSTG